MIRTTLLLLSLTILLAACEDPAAPADGEPRTEPDIVVVDHILIGVEGAPRMTRGDPLEEARKKAYELVEQLKNGADWNKLKNEHSDDGPPNRPAGGPYTLSNTNVQERFRGVVPRGQMVKGFSDVAFSLDVGEVGVADYDTKDSPFGFHIMKRLPLGPDYVTVDHILIGVKGPRMPNGDTDEVARKKAYDLLEQLKQGGNWAELKRAHSDDPPPGGPYTMANHGQKPRSQQEFPRGNMAPAFGDVGFALEVGEMAVADYDQRSSPFGYHIIKRTK